MSARTHGPDGPVDLSGPGRHVHLVGIGGAGMSAIAEVLVAMGHRVSGSDRQESAVLARLRTLGIDARAGHDARNVEGADLVGVSTAIAGDNPEILRASGLGIPVLHRFALLAAIGARRSTLSISGTHGKTTTTAMTVAALEGAGLAPGYIVGGEVVGRGSGARWSDGPWFVLEADESDSTFLAPPRAGAVVTNVEADHLDHHGTFEALEAAFDRFVGETQGPVVICADDPGSARLVAIRPDAITYGTSAGSRVRIDEVRVDGGAMSWSARWGDGAEVRCHLPLPGLHLARNATAALTLAVAVGADPAAARDGLAGYRGVGRRFEHRGRAGGVTFVDDYAHLPTEVRAVLDTAAAGDWSRVVAVVQPHRYSRTEATAADYATVFEGVDVVVVTDVYPAGEAPRPGVSGKLVVDAVRRGGQVPVVEWWATRDELVEGLVGLLRAGDLCLTLGAGDLTTVPDVLVARLGGET